jgi:hypothetical protein
VAAVSRPHPSPGCIGLPIKLAPGLHRGHFFRTDCLRIPLVCFVLRWTSLKAAMAWFDMSAGRQTALRHRLIVIPSPSETLASLQTLPCQSIAPIL